MSKLYDNKIIKIHTYLIEIVKDICQVIKLNRLLSTDSRRKIYLFILPN